MKSHKLTKREFGDCYWEILRELTESDTIDAALPKSRGVQIPGSMWTTSAVYYAAYTSINLRDYATNSTCESQYQKYLNDPKYFEDGLMVQPTDMKKFRDKLKDACQSIERKKMIQQAIEL